MPRTIRLGERGAAFATDADARYLLSVARERAERSFQEQLSALESERAKLFGNGQ